MSRHRRHRDQQRAGAAEVLSYTHGVRHQRSDPHDSEHLPGVPAGWPRPGRVTLLALGLFALLFAAATHLRTANLGRLAFHVDEPQTMAAAAGYAFGGEFRLWNFLENTAGAPYPGGWPLTWQVAQSFRLLGVSETSARLPSVLWSLALLPLLAWILWREERSWALALLAVGLVAFDNYQIIFGRHCRWYGMLITLYFGLSYLLCGLLRRHLGPPELRPDSTSPGTPAGAVPGAAGPRAGPGRLAWAILVWQRALGPLGRLRSGRWWLGARPWLVSVLLVGLLWLGFQLQPIVIVAVPAGVLFFWALTLAAGAQPLSAPDSARRGEGAPGSWRAALDAAGRARPRPRLDRWWLASAALALGVLGVIALATILGKERPEEATGLLDGLLTQASLRAEPHWRYLDFLGRWWRHRDLAIGLALGGAALAALRVRRSPFLAFCGLSLLAIAGFFVFFGKRYVAFQYISYARPFMAVLLAWLALGAGRWLAERLGAAAGLGWERRLAARLGVSPMAVRAPLLAAALLLLVAKPSWPGVAESALFQHALADDTYARSSNPEAPLIPNYRGLYDVFRANRELGTVVMGTILQDYYLAPDLRPAYIAMRACDLAQYERSLAEHNPTWFAQPMYKRDHLCRALWQAVQEDFVLFQPLPATNMVWGLRRGIDLGRLRGLPEPDPDGVEDDEDREDGEDGPDAGGSARHAD